MAETAGIFKQLTRVFCFVLFCFVFKSSGLFLALPLKASAAFKCLASERKQVTGRLTSSNLVKSLVCTTRSPQPQFLGSLNVWDYVGINKHHMVVGTAQ